ncbi:HupE/UreJ family protein [Tabrizicola fusiformis]|uniref:HupE/UreJ family protein n=1 Tax=Tabrizicola sp. SY72 TaxID=2741673 RepID=UPI001573C3E5|nr:HupE/UreJ family protein [Tabrizicola sp. SY72]NTT87769.1 HupE/UreJ family protein [Tabrizicola sp. SY72]
MLRKLTLAAALLAPNAALAHTGHGAGSFIAGMGHPVSGLDHILAMLAVGLWAAQIGGRALWAAPAAFVGAMLAGGAMGAAGLPFPAVEPMILASIVILGALIALAVRLPLMAALPVLALFGAAHGWAHGAEGPASGMLVYDAGFAVMTAALHGAGLLAGLGLHKLAGMRVTRALGGLTAAAGLALAIGG